MLEKLRAMAIFASVVENGSFSGSAKELHITTSAVSQQVRSLENDLGVVLLNRSTRKISLTEAGELFYRSCSAMVKEAASGRALVDGLKDDMSGSVRLATSPVLARKLLMPCLVNWLSTTPELSANLLSDFSHLDLIERQIDLAVRCANNPKELPFEHYELGEVPVALWASKDYLSQFDHNLTKDRLPEANLITVDASKDNYQSRIEAGDKKLRCSSNLATNSPETAKDMAVAGLGIVKLPLCDVLEEVKCEQLVPAVSDLKLPSLTLFVATLKQDQQPAKITKPLELIKSFYEESFCRDMHEAKLKVNL